MKLCETLHYAALRVEIGANLETPKILDLRYLLTKCCFTKERKKKNNNAEKIKSIPE